MTRLNCHSTKIYAYPHKHTHERTHKYTQTVYLAEMKNQKDFVCNKWMSSWCSIFFPSIRFNLYFFAYFPFSSINLAPRCALCARACKGESIELQT